MAEIGAIQGAAGTLYLITITIVALRMLLLARRTGERPELLLGLSLLLGGTIGSTMEAGGLSAAGQLGAANAGKLIAVGKAFGIFGFGCQGIFIWHVFRPTERWAPILFLSLLGVMLVACFGFGWTGTYTTASIDVLWFAVELLARMAFPVWLMTESLLYYGQMRKRLALGLADPVVTNRFLLWGGIGALSILLLLTSVPPIFLDPIADEGLLLADLLLFSGCGVILSGIFWVAFFPPRWWKRALEARAAGTAS